MKLSEYVDKHQTKLTNKEVLSLFDDVEKNSDAIAKNHLALALNVADKISFDKANLDYNFSSAMLGLANAIRLFDPEIGPFIPYAKKAMMFEIYNSNRTHNDIIKKPTSNKKGFPIPSTTFIADMLHEDETVDDKLSILAVEEEDTERLDLSPLKDKLTDFQYQVIVAKYGFDNKQKTVVQIAKEFGKSTQSIYYTEKKALDKIRANKALLKYLINK